MNPLATFPDPEAAVAFYLSAAFAGRSETYKPATISTAFPTAELTKSPLRTHLQVELDGSNPADYPVTERATVRVACHAPRGERAVVKDLASLTQALLMQLANDEVAGVSPLVGRGRPVEDPTTKNLMVWFTVRVNLKATVLAS